MNAKRLVFLAIWLAPFSPLPYSSTLCSKPLHFNPLRCYSMLAVASFKPHQQMALQQVIMTQDKLLN